MKLQPTSQQGQGMQFIAGEFWTVEDLKTYRTGPDSCRLVTEVSPSLFSFRLAVIGPWAA